MISTGPVLQGLGAIESDIYMEGDKISTILRDHPEMTLAEIKKIPQILEDPALVLKSKTRGGTSNTRLVLLDTAKAKNRRNIVAVLDLRPVEKGFAIDDIQKISSAYTKTATENRTAKENSRDFLKTSDVLFLDKKRATSLLKTMGFSMPIELHRNGYVGSISYFKQNVNIKGLPFSSVVGEGDVQFSLREPVEETRDLLALHNMTADNLRGALEPVRQPKEFSKFGNGALQQLASEVGVQELARINAERQERLAVLDDVHSG